MTELTPIDPGEAVELYLRAKESEFANSTFDANRSRLGFLVDWCHDQGVTNLNDLTARDIHDFQAERRETLNIVSEHHNMGNIQRFIEWCETIDAVEPGLYDKIYVPPIKEGGVRDEVLERERAGRIVDHLETFEYASTAHVCWVILTNTGMRLGSARALDVEDYHSEDDTPYLDIRHRPDTDTPLKNGESGERPVSIDDGVCEVLGDYLEHNRPSVTDGYSREPLLATTKGRVARSTIRKYAYMWSRPCEIGRECPHDRNPLECDAATDLDQVAQCPSSVSPHPIRRGYITKLLRQDVPVDVVSERCDVSPEIIELHYDVRSEEAKMRQRQRLLNEALDEEEAPSTG